MVSGFYTIVLRLNHTICNQVNTKEDEHAKLASFYSIKELVFFKALVRLDNIPIDTVMSSNVYFQVNSHKAMISPYVVKKTPNHYSIYNYFVVSVHVISTVDNKIKIIQTIRVQVEKLIVTSEGFVEENIALQARDQIGVRPAQVGLMEYGILNNGMTAADC